MTEMENNDEQYVNWVAPDSRPTPETPGRRPDTRAARLDQPFTSRLCEYITGLKPEDPTIIERLAQDREIIRAKYKLPSLTMPPSERERALRMMAKELGVRIVPTHETGSYFKENPLAKAVHLDDDRIGVDVNQRSLATYQDSLMSLEHEVIHARQKQMATAMPIELQEYEAYVASANTEYLKQHPEAVQEALFGFLIGGSVNTYYHEKSQERGEEVVPEWERPEYFIALDERRAASSQSMGKQ